MRNSSFAILTCAAWLALVAPPSRAQDEVKKQLDAQQKQLDLIQKTLKDIQAGQMKPKDVEDLKTRLKDLESQQKTLNTIQQQTAPRQAPVVYRAEIVAAPSQLYSPVGARRGGPILSPYLNLVKGQDLGGPIDVGIQYGLDTRAEFQRRSDAREFAGQIYDLQQQVQQQAGFATGISTTGYRAYFDTAYGRPGRQLYHRTPVGR